MSTATLFTAEDLLAMPDDGFRSRVGEFFEPTR